MLQRLILTLRRLVRAFPAASVTRTLIFAVTLCLRRSALFTARNAVFGTRSVSLTLRPAPTGLVVDRSWKAFEAPGTLTVPEAVALHASLPHETVTVIFGPAFWTLDPDKKTVGRVMSVVMPDGPPVMVVPGGTVLGGTVSG
ncbi:MAG: hypothetical protein H0W95_08785, partial [Nocardioidaceae bacterium]|nr:hypothetical protein [Nocardioidaceae bacterium]